MRIIDLLNKIANGKEPPKKIMFGLDIYNYVEEEQDYKHEKLNDWLFDDYTISHILNDEVEILETTITLKDSFNYLQKLADDEIPNKIEKLEITQEKNCNNNWKWKLNGYNISTPQKIMSDKINEIIDKVNEL